MDYEARISEKVDLSESKAHGYTKLLKPGKEIAADSDLFSVRLALDLEGLELEAETIDLCLEGGCGLGGHDSWKGRVVV